MFRSGYVGDFSGNPRCLCVNVICMASELQQLVMQQSCGGTKLWGCLRHRQEGKVSLKNSCSVPVSMKTCFFC